MAEVRAVLDRAYNDETAGDRRRVLRNGQHSRPHLTNSHPVESANRGWVRMSGQIIDRIDIADDAWIIILYYWMAEERA